MVRSSFVSYRYVLLCVRVAPSLTDDAQNMEITTTYAEFIGTVVDAGTLKMMAVVGMGEDLGVSSHLCAW